MGGKYKCSILELDFGLHLVVGKLFLCAAGWFNFECSNILDLSILTEWIRSLLDLGPLSRKHSGSDGQMAKSRRWRSLLWSRSGP